MRLPVGSGESLQGVWGRAQGRDGDRMARKDAGGRHGCVVMAEGVGGRGQACWEGRHPGLGGPVAAGWRAHPPLQAPPDASAAMAPWQPWACLRPQARQAQQMAAATGTMNCSGRPDGVRPGCPAAAVHPGRAGAGVKATRARSSRWYGCASGAAKAARSAEPAPGLRRSEAARSQQARGEEP